MARLFDDGSSEYLIYASGAVVSAVPLTMACWFNSDTTADTNALMTITDFSSWGDWFMLAVSSVEQVIANDDATATTSTAWTVNTWNHACGVWASTSSRIAYLNAGGKVEDTTSTTISNLDRTAIGVQPRGNGYARYFSGMIAEAAIWNVALTDAEVALLAAGYSPLLVRPQSLVFYAPLIRDEDRDIVGGLALTPVNTPSIAAHPRVIYAPPRYSFIQAAGAPPGVTVPPLYYHYVHH